MTDERQELLDLQTKALAKSRAAMERGELGPARGYVEIAWELARQYAHLTGEHREEFDVLTDLDREF